MSKKTLFELVDLVKHYPIVGGVFRRKVGSVRAVDGLNLSIHQGECLGMVGESGCGKTTLGKTIIKLHEPTSGTIDYLGSAGGAGSRVDIAPLTKGEMKTRGIRGKLQMVFQDPTTSLNPRMLVKNIIAEPIRVHESLGGREMEARVVDLLRLVGLTQDHLLRYPHEFSGGQRQRIAVARALATHPEFIVLDEPTSALDVSVQAQILNLLKRLQNELGLTYLFVTHHLLVVKYISDRVAVMYLGRVVEIAPTSRLFARPLHPYTHALLSGIPVPEIQLKKRRIVLTGDVPSPVRPPSGCRFHTRCPFVLDLCKEKEPALVFVTADHQVACHRQAEVEKLVADRFGN